MTMPIDTVFVRHGQSEGNAANRRSEAGDHGVYTDEFRRRHSASFRLTNHGIQQAMHAGVWIRTHMDHPFDRYLTSEYTRAMETAALLNLPGALWFGDYNLTERDWGDLDSCPQDEREKRFGDALARRDIEPFFWSPPNGESFRTLCLRLNRVLDTLHRECSEKRVIIVCHGEVMWAARVCMERMSQMRFRELHMSTDPAHRIYNCQIIHYTRRNPHTGELEPHANWVRMIRPNDKSFDSNWRRVERPRYTNEDLINIVVRVPRMVA